MKREPCPKCNKLMVYSHHFSNDWAITCLNCGFSTKNHKTYRETRKEWDLIKREIIDYGENNN